MGLTRGYPCITRRVAFLAGKTDTRCGGKNGYKKRKRKFVVVVERMRKTQTHPNMASIAHSGPSTRTNHHQLMPLTISPVSCRLIKAHLLGFIIF